VAAGHPASDPLSLQRNPLRLLPSPAPWVATAYLASYLPIGALCFAIGIAVAASAVVNITWLALPWLIGMAAILRGAATLERQRAQLVGPPIPVPYQQVVGTGMFAHIRTRWRDRATYRDCAYLVGMFAPLIILDLVALAAWLACLAGITLPAWYWSVPAHWNGGPTVHGIVLGHLPHGPRGPGGFGVWIGSPLAAGITAAVSLGLAPFAAYIVVGAAITHRALARTLLGPYIDPLREAKNVLAAPGPLPAFEPGGGS
jgi:hypothetical protein